LLIVSAFWGALKVWHERRLSPANTFFLCWSLFCLLFFSVSKSKLPGYILPAIPVIGILLARCLVGLAPMFLNYFRRLLALFGSVFAAAGILLYLGLGHLRTSPITATASRNAALVLLMFACANWVLAFHKTKFDSRTASAACCVLPVLLLASYVPKLLPGFVPYDPSGRTLAADIMSTHTPFDMQVGPIPRGQYFSLNFYLHRELKEWDKTNPQAGYLLLRFKGCSSFLGPGWTCSSEPIELPKCGWFIYRVQPDALPGGLGGGNIGNKLGDLQPR